MSQFPRCAGHDPREGERADLTVRARSRLEPVGGEELLRGRGGETDTFLERFLGPTTYSVPWAGGGQLLPLVLLQFPEAGRHPSSALACRPAVCCLPSLIQHLSPGLAVCEAGLALCRRHGA